MGLYSDKYGNSAVVGVVECILVSFPEPSLPFRSHFWSDGQLRNGGDETKCILCSENVYTAHCMKQWVVK